MYHLQTETEYQCRIHDLQGGNTIQTFFVNDTVSISDRHYKCSSTGWTLYQDKGDVFLFIHFVSNKMLLLFYISKTHLCSGVRYIAMGLNYEERPYQIMQLNTIINKPV